MSLLCANSNAVVVYRGGSQPIAVERLVHPEEPEPEPDVEHRVGLAAAQLLHRRTVLGRHLRDRHLAGDAQAGVDARAPSGPQVLLTDQRLLERDPDARRPSCLATAAMMTGSSSIEPLLSAKTHSPNMLSVAAIVMHGTSASSSM